VCGNVFINQIMPSRSPNPRTIGWNGDRHSPAQHIKDSDRETPARDRPEWKEFKATFGANRVFENWTMEELHARIFEETERMVLESELAFEIGKSTYTLGINQFADWTEDEFLSIVTSDPRIIENNAQVSSRSNSDQRAPIPKELDWRTLIRIAPVRRQGGCGACSPFAAISITEAQFAMSNIDVDLSEQFVMDCSSHPGGLNYGCSGGWVENIFSWLKENNRGIPTRTDVPYLVRNGVCPANSVTDQWKTYYIKNYTIGPIGDEDELRYLINDIGPFTSSIEGTTLLSYKQGIFNPSSCGNPNYSALHTVAVLGYGIEEGNRYWLVRNSWGDWWGEEGYFRIARGVNKCSFANWTTFVTVNQGK
ncbi:hypothetical protein PMAYCL1PPCAC_25825, partial [Pristionchus mayeri]